MEIKRSEHTERWSQIVEHGNVVYLSGVVADNWDADFEQQAREMLAQVETLLHKAGSDKSKILTMTFWLADLEDYARFNAVYDTWVDKSSLPARATVQAGLADPRLRIEVMTTAAR